MSHRSRGNARQPRKTTQSRFSLLFSLATAFLIPKDPESEGPLTYLTPPLHLRTLGLLQFVDLSRMRLVPRRLAKCHATAIMQRIPRDVIWMEKVSVKMDYL